MNQRSQLNELVVVTRRFSVAKSMVCDALVPDLECLNIVFIWTL